MHIRPFLQIQSRMDTYSYPLSKVNSKDVSTQVYIVLINNAWVQKNIIMTKQVIIATYMIIAIAHQENVSSYYITQG